MHRHSPGRATPCNTLASKRKLTHACTHCPCIFLSRRRLRANIFISSRAAGCWAGHQNWRGAWPQPGAEEATARDIPSTSKTEARCLAHTLPQPTGCFRACQAGASSAGGGQSSHTALREIGHAGGGAQEMGLPLSTLCFTLAMALPGLRPCTREAMAMVQQGSGS